jgi:RAQPRD family integrative conjugative element protein
MRTSVLVVGLLMSVALYANAMNKVYLARANTQLGAVLENVEKAQDSDKGNHVQTFNYKVLQADITKIRTGIQNYINDERVNPANIEVLRGNYE